MGVPSGAWKQPVLSCQSILPSMCSTPSSVQGQGLPVLAASHPPHHHPPGSIASPAGLHVQRHYILINAMSSSALHPLPVNVTSLCPSLSPHPGTVPWPGGR